MYPGYGLTGTGTGTGTGAKGGTYPGPTGAGLGGYGLIGNPGLIGCTGLAGSSPGRGVGAIGNFPIGSGGVLYGLPATGTPKLL